MANILQVTNSGISTEAKNIGDAQSMKTPMEGQQIRNPSDPSRVMRADGQESGKSGTATGEKSFGVAGYGSHYGAFLAALTGGADITKLLESLFSGQGAGRTPEVAQLLQQLLTSVQLQQPEELAAFLKEQVSGRQQFAGPFFDKLRALLGRELPQGLRESALEFLRAYNSYASGAHLLRQMNTVTQDLTVLLPPAAREQFEGLLREMDWRAADGDTRGNIQTLYGKVIPFLARYISGAHDYGPLRSAVLRLVLLAAKYENGEGEQLRQLFEQIAGNKEVARLFSGDPQAAFAALLAEKADAQSGRGFADVLSSLILKGTAGQAGAEQMQPFYQLLNGMLLGESVYLPLLHFVLPFRYGEQEVTSELWVDPDSDKDEGQEEGRGVTLLLRFRIGGVGDVELAATVRARQVGMQLAVPESLLDRSKEVQSQIADIFHRNGMEVRRFSIAESGEPMPLEQVFPGVLARKEKMVDVRI